MELTTPQNKSLGKTKPTGQACMQKQLAACLIHAKRVLCLAPAGDLKMAGQTGSYLQHGEILVPEMDKVKRARIW